MKKIFLFAFLLAPGWIFSQAIVKGSGIVYTNGAPTHTVNFNTDAEIAIDTTTGHWWERSRDGLGWLEAGFRVQKLAGSSPPSAAPADKESEVVVNDVDSLYQWRSGAWRHLNKVVTYTAGTGISISGGNVISNTGDLSATNEGTLGVGAGGASTSVLLSNTSGATGVTFQVTGIATITESTSSNGGTITIGATEIDGSTSNELQTYAHSGTTSYTNTLSNGGGSFTLQASGIVSISNSSGTVTISATETDGSTSNELQTIANTSDATSHTATLSNSGGSLQLVEGANITLTTSGTGLNGIVTIASSGGGGSTDLAYSGTSSPVTLTSSTGTDVTFTQGGIVTLSASSGNMTISASEVDGSTSNELQTIANTSDATSHTVTLSNSGGSLQLVEGANITLTTSGTGLNGIVTIAATSGGGTDLAFSGAGSPVTLTSSSGTDVTFTEGGIVTLSATSGNVTITATEVDGSTSNELQTYAHSGTTSYTNTLSNGGGSFTLQASGIVSVSNSSGTVTIGATEVDGSTSNELQTYAHSGTTSYTNTLSNGGGSFTLQASGIVSISHTTGTVTISATEADGSTSNELQTIANTSDATSHTATLSNSGGSLQLVEGANITLTTSGTGLNGIVTIAATSGSGTDLTFSGTSSPVTLNSSSGTDVTFTQGGIVTLSASSGNITISATETDGSTSNELQTYAHSGTTSYTNTLSNGGGSFTLQASGIVSISNSSGTVTISATEVDGSTSNELQTLANTSDATSHTATLSNSGGSLQLVEGSGITLTTSGTSLNGIVTVAAVDASASNELQTYAHSGTTSYTNTLSNSGGSFTLQASGIVSISNSSGTVTIGATEVDGSTSNELQTLASTSDATSHTVTLSNSGGSLQLVEGANITLTTSGTGLNGIVTIAATSGGGTDLAFSGTSSPVTLNSSTGTDVTFTQGGIVTLTATSGNLTISATEVDGSTLNELQTYAHSGTTSYTNTLSNGGGSFTLQASGIVSISHTTGTVTISATEVDGSTSNELQTLANTSDATSHTVTLSNSGGSLQLVEGSNVTLTTSGTGLNGIVTIASTEVDGSTSNELQTYAHSGTTSYTNTLSSGGGSFTLQASGIVSISNSSGTVTIGATEVDGSTSNELQTIANTSDATSHTATLSNSGGSLQLVEGSGITLTTSGTGLNGIVTIASTATGNTDLAFSGTSSPVTLTSSTGTDVTFTQGGIVTLSASSGNITISATETDGSTSNELQTYAHSGTTSYTNTLSNGGGSFTLQASGIVSISNSSGTVTISATETDGSTSNELQTLASTSDATSHTVTLSNSGGSLQLVEGTNITLTTSGTGLNGIVTIASTAAGGTNFASTRGYVEGVTGTTVDLDALDGKTKDVDGTNLSFDIPSNLDNFKVYKNGILLTRTGTGTTRDYSADASANSITLTASLATTDRVIVQAITGSAVDLFTSARFSGAGTSGSPLELAQQSATTGQVLAWSGSAWAPANAVPQSTISPTQITSDQDNYSPTGWAAATLVRLSSDNFRAITSFSAQSDGEVKTLLNIGSFPIYLPGQHPDGTAANRIVTPYDYFLFPGKSCSIFYDNTSSRWYITSAKDTYRKGVYYGGGFGSTTAGDWGNITLTVSGTAAATGTTQATSTSPGGLTLSTGTTNAGASMVSISKTITTPVYYSGSHISCEGTVSIPTLSDGTETFSAGVQVTTSPTSATFAPNNTIGIRYTHGTNSGKWQGFTKDNAGTESTADLGVTVAANTVYDLRIELDKQNSEARFYLDGVMAGRVTANLPTAGAAGARTVMVKSAGTTSRTLNAHSLLLEGIY